ncbi:hypothetical protein EIP91_001083 [Steccherinum ochraceum]|uniref:Uncharacterized protein n=1 Tax=Steccherinum ochraceum TaxID=92696 RepID=A0A4R0RL35_9APHY|nr:hypothetical protein EIP91_001083 [Steccherinum ochraceum]
MALDVCLLPACQSSVSGHSVASNDSSSYNGCERLQLPIVPAPSITTPAPSYAVHSRTVQYQPSRQCNPAAPRHSDHHPPSAFSCAPQVIPRASYEPSVSPGHLPHPSSYNAPPYDDSQYNATCDTPWPATPQFIPSNSPNEVAQSLIADLEAQILEELHSSIASSVRSVLERNLHGHTCTQTRQYVETVMDA